MPDFILKEEELKGKPVVPPEVERLARVSRETLNMRLTRTILAHFVDVNDPGITLTQDPYELIDNSRITEHYEPDNLKRIIINSFIDVLEKYWNQHKRIFIRGNSSIESDIIDRFLTLNEVTTKANLVREVCAHFDTPIPAKYQALGKIPDRRPAVKLHPDSTEEKHRRRQPIHSRLKI